MCFFIAVVNFCVAAPNQPDEKILMLCFLGHAVISKPHAAHCLQEHLSWSPTNCMFGFPPCRQFSVSGHFSYATQLTLSVDSHV